MNLSKWAAEGFAGRSLHWVPRILGCCRLQRQRAITNILEAARKASRWLWIKRGDELRNEQPEHKLGPDHPRPGCAGEGKNPEHPMNPGPSLTMCPGRITRCSIRLLATCPDKEALKRSLFTLLLVRLMYTMTSLIMSP